MEGQKKKVKAKGKEKAADRGTIPIPARADDEDLELSDEDMDMLEEYGGAVSFLSHLDEKGITKYVQEHVDIHMIVTQFETGARKR